MCNVKLNKLITTLLTVTFLAVALHQFFINYFYDDSPEIPKDAPVVLWWGSFAPLERFRTCGQSKCLFTPHRSYLKNPQLKTIIFYGSNFEVTDVPLPRGNTRWALLHEESPRNNPIFANEELLNMFNYSATFSRYSDVPTTLSTLEKLEDLTDLKYFVPTHEKNRLMEEEKLAPVLYIQSDCETMINRDGYVYELMKYIPIDSYGRCLNNKKLPETFPKDYANNFENEDFLKFVARYKFTIAIENGVCDDYITEKLWRPLSIGSVPIYFGSPSFRDWLPNNLSAIAVDDFFQPEELAEFLKMLLDDDSLYNKFLDHKLLPNGITNKLLLDTLKNRKREEINLFYNYVTQFECYICDKLNTNEVRMMSAKEFNCTKPKNMIYSSMNRQNFWINMWETEQCSAKLLVDYIKKNKTIQMNEFDTEATRMYYKNQC